MLSTRKELLKIRSFMRGYALLSGELTLEEWDEQYPDMKARQTELLKTLSGRERKKYA